jgi:hypothetical protein
LSEKLVYIACRTWGRDLSKVSQVGGVPAEDIRRVCRQFDAVSAVWSKLAVGESMTLDWHGDAHHPGRHHTRRR